MALDKTEMKDKILEKVSAVNGFLNGLEQSQIDAFLEAFCDGVIEHFQEKANIKMDAADFNVDPGTFQANGQAVTGVAINQAFDLQGKIE